MPSFAVYGSETDCALMVMPRSRSIGLESSTCASISRASRPPQIWMMRSASVDLPWSTWAMIEKLRMSCIGGGERRPVAESPVLSHRPRCQPALNGLARVLSTGNSGGRDGHQPGALVVAYEQAHAVALLHALEGIGELGGAADRVLAHLQDHVARREAGLARREAGDAADAHALARLQAQLAARTGIELA